MKSDLQKMGGIAALIAAATWRWGSLFRSGEDGATIARDPAKEPA